MASTLEDITFIKTGLLSTPDKEGNIPFFQLRQFNEDGLPNYENPDCIKLNEKLQYHLLKRNDILFAAKGNRLFAWCFTEEYNAVASSTFFVLTPNTSLVNPQYLVAYLNAPQTKNSLLQLGAGSNIFSIRKSELAALPITLPSLKKQQQMAALYQLHLQQIQLHKSIINQKENLYSAIVSKFIKL